MKMNSPRLAGIILLVSLMGCQNQQTLDLPKTASTSSPQLTKQPDEARSQDRKNILFILVDDLGYADIGAYNSTTFYETPNIDSLANEGVKFTNGYAANPVCSPSRYAILTGRHPTRIDATDWFHINNWPHRVEKYRNAELKEYMPLGETLLPEVLKENGYKTAFLGKWHLGEDEKHWPENQGFDINVGGHSKGQPPAGYFSPYENPRLGDGEKDEYLTQRLTNEALSLLDGYAKEDTPFLMYMSFYTVHTPLQAPAETVKKYELKGATLRGENDFLEEEQVWPTDDKRKVRVEQNHATYAAMIEHMDSSVGQLLNKLKETDLDKNTIVVFTSDNGGLSTAEGSPTSNLPLRGGKGWLYEGGVLVPFIIRTPQAAMNGSISAMPVVSTDFYPTLLELAGIQNFDRKEGDGVSLVPLLLKKQALPERPIYFHYPHYSNQGGFPGAAVRLGQWKLLERFEDGQVHLYNLNDDIEEQNDLAGSRPEKTAELKALLHQWYLDTDAKFLRPKENGGMQPWHPQT